MTSEISFDAWMITVSLVIVLTCYLLICYQDRSWLNWASTGYIVTVASIFIFPLLALVSTGPTGTTFAYFFCYTTYALSNLCLAIAYILTRRIPYSRKQSSVSPFVIGNLPWVLLAIGISFYAPIMIKFSSLLLHPREIYVITRTGYGPLVFGSRALLNLAFVVYLFKPNKRLGSAILFFSLCSVAIYLHGSKGLLLNLLSTAMLYWVYIKGRRLGFAKAAGCVVLFSLIASSMFALFADLGDFSELVTYIQGYSDYTKNAMLVIDDPARQPAWGRLTLEGEVYARIPRVLYPAKPSNFGIFKLAQDYYPEWFRSETGNPDFNIGMQYADFGPLAIIFLCFTSTFTGILTGLIVRSLDRSPSPPTFILLLFSSGLAIISFGSGYALPESAFLAVGVWLFTRPKREPADFSRRPELPTASSHTHLITRQRTRNYLMNHETTVRINRSGPREVHYNLLSVVALLLRNRREIFFWSFGAAFVGLLLALVWKPYYSATAIILPPQQQQSLAASLTAQIPQLAAGSSLSGMGLKSPGDMYVGIMQGRTVTDAVIEKLHLQAVYKSKMRSDTRNKLLSNMSFESSRDGLIRITSRAATPRLAADIANAYVDALYQINSHLAITEASQRRLFFQQQVDEQKAELVTAEDSLKATQQKTGMIQLSGQTELLLRDIANLRSQITNREVQLRSLSTFDAPENPDIQQTQQELDALHSKLAKLENTQRVSMGNISGISSASEVPAAGLEYLRKFRDVQYNENLFALLSKQLAAARLDEAKSAPVLQVVDQAAPPERKAGPSRILIVLFSAVAGVILGSLVIILRIVLPVFRQKLQFA